MNEPRAQPACGLRSGRHQAERQHQGGENEKTGNSSDLKVRLHQALGVSQSAASSASSLDSAWSTIIERHLVPWWNSAPPRGSSGVPTRAVTPFIPLKATQ